MEVRFYENSHVHILEFPRFNSENPQLTFCRHRSGKFFALNRKKILKIPHSTWPNVRFWSKHRKVSVLFFVFGGQIKGSIPYSPSNPTGNSQKMPRVWIWGVFVYHGLMLAAKKRHPPEKNVEQ